MSNPARVVVIDDDASVCRALTRLIKSAGYEVAAFSGAGEFLANASGDGAACAVVDLRMPNINGLELQEKLREAVPHLSVVFVTGHGDVPSTVRAMKAGAIDFLEKPVKDEALLSAIQRALQRSSALQAELAQLARLRDRYDRLTPRERQVFGLIAAGLLNKQVGYQIGAAEKTIKVHRARVMAKMEAGSLADLVVMAQHLGIRNA
jgi:FixJ family two-component response regulator